MEFRVAQLISLLKVISVLVSTVTRSGSLVAVSVRRPGHPSRTICNSFTHGVLMRVCLHHIDGVLVLYNRALCRCCGDQAAHGVS